jgi:hypothetical protein
MGQTWARPSMEGDDSVVKRVAAETSSRDGAAAARKEFLQQRSGLLEARANAAELEAEKAAESLPLDVLERLLNEAKEAVTRRGLPYKMLALRRDQLEEACTALAPEFIEIVRAVIDNLDQIIGHLNGRDLHHHQTSCEALLQASFRLVLESLAASCWVEKPEDLLASLANVEAAKNVYDQCMKHFYEAQADGDGMPGRTLSLLDASTMSSSTDNFMTALEAASLPMEAHMRALEVHLDQNKECLAQLQRDAMRHLLVEVEQQRHANLEEREEVVKLVEQLGDADAAIATAERDREDWARDKRLEHAAKFESDKQWIAVTTTKLNEKVKDCDALDSAIQTELELFERVATMAMGLVGRYTDELRAYMAEDFAVQKDMFDSQYEVYYRRQKILELQMEKKKREAQKLKRQYKDCVRQQDSEGAEQYERSREKVKARIVVLEDEVAKYWVKRACLDEIWMDDFLPRLRDERDKRTAIMLDVDNAYAVLAHLRLADRVVRPTLLMCVSASLGLSVVLGALFGYVFYVFVCLVVCDWLIREYRSSV